MPINKKIQRRAEALLTKHGFTFHKECTKEDKKYYFNDDKMNNDFDLYTFVEEYLKEELMNEKNNKR